MKTPYTIRMKHSGQDYRLHCCMDHYSVTTDPRCWARYASADAAEKGLDEFIQQMPVNKSNFEIVKEV